MCWPCLNRPPARMMGRSTVLWLLALARLLPNSTVVFFRSEARLAGSLEFAEQAAKRIHLGFFDAAKLFDLHRFLAMMGKGMVAHGDAGDRNDVVVAAQFHRHHAGAVGLKRKRNQIDQHVHLPDFVGNILHVVRHRDVHFGLGLGDEGLHCLQPLLHLAHAGEILVHLVAVAGADRPPRRLASSLTASRMLRPSLRRSISCRTSSGVPSRKSLAKIFDGLDSAGTFTPLRLTEMLPPEVPSTSDGKRVAIPTSSATSWSIEMLL